MHLHDLTGIRRYFHCLHPGARYSGTRYIVNGNSICLQVLFLSDRKKLTIFMDGNSLLASSLDPFPGKVTFEEADFFSLSVSEEENFDLVYDYT